MRQLGHPLPLLICLVPDVLAGTAKRFGERMLKCCYREEEAQNQPFAFYLNRLQPQELSASFPIFQNKLRAACDMFCIISVIRSRTFDCYCIQDKVMAVADY